LSEPVSWKLSGAGGDPTVRVRRTPAAHQLATAPRRGPNVRLIEKDHHMADFPDSLITPNAAAGRELALMMARKTIAAIQPNAETRDGLRHAYADNTPGLISAGLTVAHEFQTIAAANHYWR
jgi:hypothetical protein